jgi:hypothetical protein
MPSLYDFWLLQTGQLTTFSSIMHSSPLSIFFSENQRKGDCAGDISIFAWVQIPPSPLQHQFSDSHIFRSSASFFAAY